MDMAIVIKKRCEICNALFIQEYGFSLTVTWMVTGFHQGVPAFQCPHVQHWGCSPEHAMQATIACMKHKDGMSVKQLRKRHAKAQEEGHPKVAVYFQALYEEKGEGFHIIEEGN